MKITEAKTSILYLVYISEKIALIILFKKTLASEWLEPILGNLVAFYARLAHISFLLTACDAHLTNHDRAFQIMI